MSILKAEKLPKKLIDTFEKVVPPAGIEPTSSP